MVWVQFLWMHVDQVVDAICLFHWVCCCNQSGWEPFHFFCRPSCVYLYVFAAVFFKLDF
ncbi:hypothetical protein Hanom_Chr03g00191311 [Helianthus anomalus]